MLDSLLPEQREQAGPDPEGEMGVGGWISRRMNWPPVTLRADCLNQNWCLSLAEARDKIDVWWQDDSHFRPHSSLDNLPPGVRAMWCSSGCG